MKTGIMCGGLMVLLVLGVMMPGPGCARKDPVQGSAGKAVPAARFRCPMHPQIVSDKPGECPICGMALEPIAGTAPEVKDKAGIDGLAPVVLTPDIRQRMGLTVGRVEKRDMKRVLRLPARIEADETRQIRVTSKLEGFVETLFVSATGQRVKKGDPLLTLYSPPLVTAAEEFRIA
ncbi:MAG: efflux RND transporter periplasmic adaptor subunit, partial [bacterium]